MRLLRLSALFERQQHVQQDGDESAYDNSVGSQYTDRCWNDFEHLCWCQIYNCAEADRSCEYERITLFFQGS